MSKLYKLPCSCGLFIPIETNQAGRQIDCSCGQQLQAPSLSGIRNLEPVTEQEIRQKAPQRSKPTASHSIHTKQIVMVTGAIAFVVSGFLFIFFALFSTTVVSGFPYIFVKSGYPKLHDVCLMQKFYVHDGKVIGRDTQPLSPRDFRLLVDERFRPPYYVILSEEVINNEPYIDYFPIVLVEMHDNFKGGPELSYNFKEKYEKLVFYYWARFVVFGVLTIISLTVLTVGIFLPKHVEDIGERGGESWE